MSSQGTVVARVYTSDAYIPLRGVPVVFTQNRPDGSRNLLAIRFTNSSGLTEPLTVTTPNTSESLSPGTAQPYATVDIRTEYPGYSSILAENVQIFSNAETIQGLQLRPLPQVFSENSGTRIPGTSQDL